MAIETTVINMWIESVLSVDSTLIDLLGDSFTTATTIKRNTNYQVSNYIYVPVTGNDHLYKCIQSGITAKTEPIFTTNNSDLIVDGSVIWRESGSIEYRPRIFEGVAPQNAKEPFIVYNLQTPSTIKRVGGGGTDLFGEFIYQIRGTDKGGDKGRVSLIADAIDEAMNTGEDEDSTILSLNAKEYEILGCYRDIPIDIIEVADGIRYNHMGGLYRILIQAK